ncbi:MAG: FGGY family carbohydrate kinase [Kiritimatiellae bacterium]|nr:FGGY family carbohydrate kinase [Kiritimatiellia bacterium]
MNRKASRYLAMDLGASSGRGVLGTLAGGCLRLTELHRFANGPVGMGGTLYWDLPRLWGETLQALRACAGRGGAVLDGIGIDSWGVDFGLIGRDGRLNGNPLCYRDAIAEGAVGTIERTFAPARFFKLTGMALSRVSTLSQLVGLSRAAGGARLREADVMLMMPDLFRYLLCGHKAVDRTLAGSTHLTNVRTGKWSRPILKALKLPSRILPPIVRPGTAVGKVEAATAVLAGINQAPVIAVAGHDTLSAAAAAPYADDDRTVFLSTGTWSVAGVLRAAPETGENARSRGFVNELAVDGVLLARNMIGLYLFENLKRALARRDASVSYADMIVAAAAAKPFACFLDVGAPEFFVTEDPMRAAGAYLARTGRKPLRAWPALARAILEGLAWSYRQAVDDLRAITGRAFTRINMVGGGTNNALLCRMTADATGLEVLAGPAEATAAGNIGLQALATGRLRSPAAIRMLVRDSFRVTRYKPGRTASWDRAEGALRISGK